MLQMIHDLFSQNWQAEKAFNLMLDSQISSKVWAREMDHRTEHMFYMHELPVHSQSTVWIPEYWQKWIPVANQEESLSTSRCSFKTEIKGLEW